MTSAINSFAEQKGAGYAWAVDTTGSNDINAGDLVYYDTSTYQAKPLGASDDTNAATLLGVAYDSSFLNLYGTKVYQPGLVVRTTGISLLGSTTGDTYHDGDAVYAGADAQTITNTKGGLTKVIGYVKLPMGNTVAGATGTTKVPVIVIPLYPSTGVA